MATPTFLKLIFHKYKSESRRSSGDAREKCGSTVCHAIKRQELVLVVKNRDIWFEIVQRVRSFYLGNLRRRIKKIAKSLGLKDEYLL